MQPADDLDDTSPTRTGDDSRTRRTRRRRRRRPTTTDNVLARASLAVGLLVSGLYWLPSILPGAATVGPVASQERLLVYLGGGHPWSCCCGEALLPLVGVALGLAAFFKGGLARWEAWVEIVLCVVNEVAYLAAVVEYIKHARLPVG